MKYLLILLIMAGCAKDGAPGKDASPCLVDREDNKSTISCPDGSTVAIYDGNKGEVGDRGPAGATGQPGDPGVDATPIAMVQLCPGYVSHYPNIFPEVGICVSHSLYGVYWDGHNSWLAYIPLGYYASTSTSAPCNFTVLADCQVQ